MDTTAAPPTAFSPWRSVPGASCRSCAYALGWSDGLVCQRTQLAPNGYACHAWERAPGVDDG